jgi:Peptidase family S41/N-terminal domain of Peptidase_S41 in eukaryotic IRBP
MSPLPLLLTAAVIASSSPRPVAHPTVDAARRKTIVEGLASALKAHYVFPEVAEYSAEMLLQKLAGGGFSQDRPEPLAAALTRDLQALTEDRHFRVRFDPDFQGPADLEAEGTPQGRARSRRLASRENFGLTRVKILPGNVGLIDLQFFAPADVSAPAVAAAMKLLSSTDALILDVRHNRGGDPDTMAHLCSYFFPEGSRVHLDDIYYRTRNVTRQLWTQAVVSGPRYIGKPIYVLTSARTVSVGEELSYDLRVQQRATLIGETTGGTANRGASLAVGGGFVAFVPTGEAINPVTRTSWERVGVEPDLPAPAARALPVAHAAALRAILQGESDPCRRTSLERTLATVEKGEPKSHACRRS